MDKIQSPSIEESFWSSATVSRELRTRLQRDAAELWTALPAAPPPETEVAAVRETLARRGASFTAWAMAPDRSVVVDVTPAAGASGHPSRAEWRALAAGEPVPERRADSVRFFRADSTGPSRCIGFRLDPATAHAFDTAGEDYTRYRQLFVFEAVWKRGLFAALVVTFLVTALAAFLAARYTARRIGRPVTELARSADRLAAGDLAHRADVRAEGEIADLVGAFNRMGAELERSRDRLLRMERVAAWRDVARRVAHEIRNPLTPIRLALHRLTARLPDDAAARECLGSISEEIGTLERLSSSFSEFAKLPDARLETIDLAKLAASVVELHQEGEPGVRVTYEGPESLPAIGDRDLLRRAATNLVKNAGEALAGRIGHVRVRVRSEGAIAVLEVEDDGPGIPADLAAAIGRPGVTGKPGGSGLGLAIVDRIATDHGGSLSWRSEPSRTIFRLVIPVPADAPREVP